MPRGTALRNVRVADEVWLPVKERAAARGATASDVVRAALALYLDDEVRALLGDLLDAHDDDEMLEGLGSSMAVRDRACALLGLMR